MASTTPQVDLFNEPVYLALEMDTIRLLVPQSQCIAIVPADNLQPNSEPNRSAVGQIIRAGQRWPIYALDMAFQITQAPPASRQQCILISAAAGQIGLLCDRTFPIERSDLTVGPIPECMHSSTLLFGGLAIYQDQIAFISTGDILYQQLDNHTDHSRA
jgi:hypothetical protein